jgi:hypothetical protein
MVGIGLGIIVGSGNGEEVTYAGGAMTIGIGGVILRMIRLEDGELRVEVGAGIFPAAPIGAWQAASTKLIANRCNQ